MEGLGNMIYHGNKAIRAINSQQAIMATVIHLSVFKEDLPLTRGARDNGHETQM